MNPRSELWLVTVVGIVSLVLCLVGGPWWWTLTPGLISTVVAPALLVRLLGGPRWPVGFVGIGLALGAALALLVPLGVIVHLAPWVQLDRIGWFVGLLALLVGLWAVGLFRVPGPRTAPRGLQLPWWRGIAPTTVAGWATAGSLLLALVLTGVWAAANQQSVLHQGQDTEVWLDRNGQDVTISVRGAATKGVRYEMRVKESGNPDQRIPVELGPGELFTHTVTITDAEQAQSGRWAVLEVDLYEKGKTMPVRSVYLDEMVEPKE